MSKLTNEIQSIISAYGCFDETAMDVGVTAEGSKLIAEKCRDTAIEAILSLPARNLTRQQAIQVINKAFGTDED